MKGKSLLEVISVFVLFEIIFMVYKSTELLRTEVQLSGWSYLAGSVMIIIPGLILIAARKPTSVYGLSLTNWKETLDSGMIFALVRGSCIQYTVVNCPAFNPYNCGIIYEQAHF